MSPDWRHKWLCPTPQYLFFLLSLSTSLAAKREGVVVSGPTTGPGFFIPTSKPLTKCPSDHAYILSDGSHCCQISEKANNTALSPTGDCDGGKIRYTTSLECCPLGLYVPCPDQERGCNNAKYPVCPKIPSPSLVSGSTSGNANMVAEDILSFVQCEVSNHHHYYRGPNGENNKVFVIDLGCQVLVSQIHVRNSRNSGWNDCGTKDFSVELSHDQGSWTMLLEDVLPDARGTPMCDIPIHTYNISPVHLGRYARFTSKTRYGACVALHFLDFTVHY